MRVGLVLHGDPPTRAELGLLELCDVVVCADGGAGPVLDAGRVPDYIVGDMDSLGEGRAKEAEARGAHVERLPPAKDETDGERALQRALSLDPLGMLILGAHGGRTAMFLAGLRLLRRAHEAGVEAKLCGRREVAQFASPGRPVELRHPVGTVVSVLAEGGDAVVSLRGLRWRLDRERLGALGSRGLSNAMVDPIGGVEVHEGLALVVVEGGSALPG